MTWLNYLLRHVIKFTPLFKTTVCEHHLYIWILYPSSVIFR